MSSDEAPVEDVSLGLSTEPNPGSVYPDVSAAAADILEEAASWVDADAAGDEALAASPEASADAAGDEGLAASPEADDEPVLVYPVPPPAMCQTLFVDVVLVLPSTNPIVILQEADPPYRELHIPVGGAEGIAIGYAARSIRTPRPLTHELMASVLDAFGLILEVVRITSVVGKTFTAEIVLAGRLGTETLDCRPSDAIALALRQRLPVPIMVAPSVLDLAASDPVGAN